jgi:hypothetical protein
MITSLILAVMESRSKEDNSIILDGSADSEINSPLIKIDEDLENPIPPKAE